MSIEEHYKETGEYWYTSHQCESIANFVDRQFSGYGHAISSITYNDEKGLWMADNGEYSTGINFCPWCGHDFTPGNEKQEPPMGLGGTDGDDDL